MAERRQNKGFCARSIRAPLNIFTIRATFATSEYRVSTGESALRHLREPLLETVDSEPDGGAPQLIEPLELTSWKRVHDSMKPLRWIGASLKTELVAKMRFLICEN
jgi:hypothetical protein